MSMLNVLLVILAMVGVFYFFLGVRNKSQLTIFFGGVTFFALIFYILNWIIVWTFAPLIALVLSHLMMKRVSST